MDLWLMFVLHILRCCQRRIKPLRQVTCTENFVKFGYVIFDICEWTDIQTYKQTDMHRDRLTYRHADRNTLHSSRGQSNDSHKAFCFRTWWLCFVLFSLQYFDAAGWITGIAIRPVQNLKCSLPKQVEKASVGQPDCPGSSGSGR